MNTEATAPNNHSDQINNQSNQKIDYSSMTRKELIEAIQQLLNESRAISIRKEVDSIKNAFYRINSIVTPEMSEEEISKISNTYEEQDKQFRSLLAKYKELKNSEMAKIELIEKENLSKKKAIIEQLEALTKHTDDLSTTIPQFRKLQSEWKEIGDVCKSEEKTIWKSYNHFQEQFYDLIQIDHELRELDFKKNLQNKNHLIQEATKLYQLDDIISAFRNLQLLHKQWREIGPVAREIREETWEKFKEVSTNINKKHQAYFEHIKEIESKLNEEKNEICKQIEAINSEVLKTYKDWEAKAEEIKKLRVEFTKTISEHRIHPTLYKRCKTACDTFFHAKTEFYKRLKSELQDNLTLKRKLCEIAEDLKDNTDWNSTTEKYIKLQKQWKSIGSIPKKYSDTLWKRFTTACDTFFENKNKNFASKKEIEQSNLVSKKEIIEKIKSFTLSGNDSEDIKSLKELTEAYNAIGHVPYKDKDKIYKAYKKAADIHFDTIRSNQRSSRVNKLSTNRTKLLRQFDHLKNEIQTYENNIGFFSKSNKDSSMVKEMERKLENLKKEFQAIIIKIDEIDKSENKN